jgi:hypothetical protein
LVYSKMKLRKRNLDIRLVLGVSLAASLILMLFDKTKEFGTNFFTEISGVAITIFVINKILERKERQKRIAIDQRILRELQSIIASYFSIWKHLMWKYLPNEKIEKEADLIKHFPTIVKLTSIQDSFEFVSIHHPESWRLFFHNRPIKECFENYHTTLTSDMQVLINDFRMYLEPELLDLMLNIMESQCLRNILTIGQEGTEKILIELEQDTNSLASYLDANDISHLQLFTKLISYSKELEKMIDNFTEVNVELYQMEKYFKHPLR